MTPFRVAPPAVVSFSGGRTSGYMLWRVLQAHGGALPDGAFVVFSNTGREHEATYRFIEEIGKRWCKVTWLEYRDAAPGYEEVTATTASRNGEPFSALIAKRKFLPNPTMRFCTTELKIRPTIKFARDHGGDEGFTNLVGLRADEPRRVARIKGDRKAESVVCPLALDGITREDVMRFWSEQNFDLELPHGMDAFGNCDLCFLKARGKIDAVMRAEPERAAWWIEQERAVGETFRNDRPRYSALLQIATSQQALDFGGEDTIPCYCTE